MPRTARIIVPDAPHHVIQRGNRRQDVFFSDQDYKTYLALMKDKSESVGTDILAYCLMPNHIHMILTPLDETGLRIIGEVHRLYTLYINRKMDWQGYLWQGRFGSYPMDERYLFNALRYVELNPVFAGLCDHPAEYRWSSARQRIQGMDNQDLKIKPVLNMIDDWNGYWADGITQHQAMQAIEENTRSLKSQIKPGASGTQ